MKIKVELSDSSIDSAIQQIEEYRKSLISKLEKLVETLAVNGVAVASASIGAMQGDSIPPTVGYEFGSDGEIVKASVFISGKDVLFVEFGAGIAYNTGAAHPKAEELGYGVGTYPSKHPPNKAINPGYWYYIDGAGNSHRSIGTQAAMPLNNAIVDARNNYIKQAIDIFRSE